MEVSLTLRRWFNFTLMDFKDWSKLSGSVKLLYIYIMIFVKALLIEHHNLSLNYVKKCVYNVDLREYSMWIHFGSMQLRSIYIKVFKLAI